MPVATAKRANSYDETQFDMPRIAQSKPVLWFPDRHLPECYTALVTRVDDRSVDVAIILPELVTLQVKTGVRHRNDPDGEIIDRSRNGVWDFPEDDGNSKLLVDMARHIAGLRERVDKLEKK